MIWLCTQLVKYCLEHVRTMDAISIDVFARQLIADKCSALIESQAMLPENILAIVRRARDDYYQLPNNKNYEYLKKLFVQINYIEDAVEYKDFNRRLLLIAFKFALNKSKEYFTTYRSVLTVALKRLDGINPDMKDSPRALLQHYNECLENLDNPKSDEHYLVVFGKEIISKIFIETIDLYSYNNKSPFELENNNNNGRGNNIMAGVGAGHNSASIVDLNATTLQNNIVKKQDNQSGNLNKFKIVAPLFSL
nr:ac106/107 [Calliteara abietis nucleopolyhedrovirus]